MVRVQQEHASAYGGIILIREDSFRGPGTHSVLVVLGERLDSKDKLRFSPISLATSSKALRAGCLPTMRCAAN